MVLNLFGDILKKKFGRTPKTWKILEHLGSTQVWLYFPILTLVKVEWKELRHIKRCGIWPTGREKLTYSRVATSCWCIYPIAFHFQRAYLAYYNTIKASSSETEFNSKNTCININVALLDEKDTFLNLCYLRWSLEEKKTVESKMQLTSEENCILFICPLLNRLIGSPLERNSKS